MNKLNFFEVDFSSIELDGIDHNDYPDYCDAFICYAETKNGQPLTDDQLDILNEDSDLVYNAVIDKVF